MDVLEKIAIAARNALRDLDVSEAWVYGSCARGDMSEESDVDVRLVCGPGIGYGDLYRVAQRMGAELGRRVDIVTCPLEDMRPSFRDRVLADQVMVYAAA